MSYGYMKKKEERKYGNRRGDELPEELSTRGKRLEAIKKPRLNSKLKPKKKPNKNNAYQ